MDSDAIERFEEAVREDGRYPLEAFKFLQRGLHQTSQALFGEEPSEGPRHITGQQFCEGLRMLALSQWGPLARDVLKRWNIHATRDFGEMVYIMIGLGLMGRQDSDSIDDFNAVYEFETAFANYEIDLDDDAE